MIVHARLIPCVLASALTGIAHAAEVGYYSQPALHGERLIFVSEGDLWTATVPQAAGSAADSAGPIIAHRLTTSDGSESRPCISPDGGSVAFSAQYDGNTDVYVMPVDGGMPTRLTFHPDWDIALAWTADGESVLFSSARAHQFGRPELWRVGVGGGSPTRYEFGECTMIALSGTGKRAAFTRWSNENWTWKRYRGGTAPEIWVADLLAGNFTQLTRDRANDMFPMWLGDRVYFLSDRTGTANIFSESPDRAGDLKQHTSFASAASDPTAIEGYDVRWPSADSRRRGARIVFCQAGSLALLDVSNDTVQRLDVKLASDRVAARQRFAPLNETLTEYALAPDGKSLLVGSRGEIVSLPVEPGASRQLTHTSNAREWGAAYLKPDQLVMISDAAGEQQIAAAPADGSAPPSLVTEDREAWLFPPAASPDGNWIAFGDKTLRLHILDMRSLRRDQVDQSEAGEMRDYRFSPDSQWLAYTKPMPNGMGMIHLYSIRTGRSFAVSSGLHDDGEPRWDPAGKYLYFLSNRHLNPMMGETDFEHIFINATEIFVVPLAAQTPPPIKPVALAAGFDLEKWAKAPADTEDKEDQKDEDGQEEGEGDLEAGDAKPQAGGEDAMRVDTDGISARQYRLPIPPGNYSNLEALWGSIAYLANPTLGLMDDSWPNPPAPQGVLHRYDLLKEKDKTLAEKLSSYALSAKRTVIAHPVVDDKAKVVAFNVINADGEGEPKKIDAASHQLRMDIRQEWRQILVEAWRLQRDFYWAPNYVGLNWPAMREKYEALLPRIGTRNELNDLIGQLIGELGTSHTYIWGGEQQDQIKPVSVGMLGADIEFDGRGFRIARIVPGQPWGQEQFTSPLEPAHLSVEAGSYIVAINGISLIASTDLHDLLQDQAGKMVRLTITDDAAGTNQRTIEVKTLGDERPLRYAAWVEANRKYVEEKSQGKLGYLHIPDMGGMGLVMFSRHFYPQVTKQGMVIDIRDNGGGFVSQMIVQRFARKVWAFMEPRHGVRERYPSRTIHGHLAVLIDQHAGSDGDIFPASFKMLGLGPLIGTRTWGGVVGIRGDKPFVDKGLSTQPEFAWWEPKGGWSIENEGVSPDIEVDISPSDRAAGRDPQLDRAIEHLMQRLKEQPMDLPQPPPWPVRVK